MITDKEKSMTNFYGWTLFLDRDGVINKRIPGSYVRHWGEFDFLEGALEAIASFKTNSNTSSW